MRRFFLNYILGGLRWFLKPFVLYSLLFIFMVGIFYFYPKYIEDQVFMWLRDIDELKTNVDLHYRIMKYVPLVFMTILGLFTAVLNTFVYCIFDTEDTWTKFNKLLSIISILLVASIICICLIYYQKFRNLLYDQKEFEQFCDLYSDFSSWVTLLTFFVFFFFLFMDIAYGFFVKTNTIKDPGKLQEKSIDKKYSILQLTMIDIPVILSSLYITYYGNNMDGSILPTNYLDRHLYMNVFTAGAWGMQVVYSQIVFYALMCLSTLELHYNKIKTFVQHVKKSV